PDAKNAICDGSFPALPTVPNSNSAEIAVEKDSAVIAGGGLSSFVGLRIQNIRGMPTPGCPAEGLTNEMVVPRSSPCVAGLGISSKRTVRLSSADRGVQITAVTAAHGSSLDPPFLSDPLKTSLADNGLSAFLASPNGFVLTFTNDLRVYLTGDTGLTSD